MKKTVILLAVSVISALFLCFLAAKMSEVFADSEEDVVYGDVNDDGKVTSSDIVRLKKYFAAFDPDTQTSTVTIGKGADANGDGKITSSDVVRLKKFFAAFDPDKQESSVLLGPEKETPLGDNDGWSQDIR